MHKATHHLTMSLRLPMMRRSFLRGVFGKAYSGEESERYYPSAEILKPADDKGSSVKEEAGPSFTKTFSEYIEKITNEENLRRKSIVVKPRENS